MFAPVAEQKKNPHSNKSWGEKFQERKLEVSSSFQAFPIAHLFISTRTTEVYKLEK